MINTICFNTGRYYSKDGQRIVAWLEPYAKDGLNKVHFMDIDRGINGYFFYGDVNLNEEVVMLTYDNGFYKSEQVPEQLLVEARKLGWESDFWKI